MPTTYTRGDYIRDTAALNSLDRAAMADGRDLTVAERKVYDETTDRLATFAEHAERGRAIDAGAAVNRAFVDGGGLGRAHTQPVARGSLERSVGEYVLDTGRSMLGNIGAPNFRQYADDGLGRVVAHGVAADGTAPVTIEGDLIKFVDANRYAVNAARRLPMPDNHAPTFKRPRVSQRTTVGQQVTEGDILSSQRLQLTGDTITKLTRGGTLSLSEQEVDWTDPAMLGQAFVDLAESYAIDTDTVLTAAITAAASDATETVLSLTPTAAQFIAAISAAANVAYTAAKRLPDTLFVDVNWWSTITAMVDTTGRPLFPVAGPYNDAGQNPGGVSSFGGASVQGLRLVVDPNFAANTLIVAVSSLVEFYEQDKGLVQINVPSTLEVAASYRGYVAANVYPQGLALIEAV